MLFVEQKCVDFSKSEAKSKMENSPQAFRDCYLETFRDSYKNRDLKIKI